MAISSWDDFPVHQTSEYVRHVATSDRNFYDRYYFNLHGSSDEVMTIFGLGQYPNLGVTDAFLAVGTKDKHRVVRASKPLVDRADLLTLLESQRRAVLAARDLITVRRQILDTRVDLHLCSSRVRSRSTASGWKTVIRRSRRAPPTFFRSASAALPG